MPRRQDNNKLASPSLMHENTRHKACNPCRERKIKCDGARPSCLRCNRYGAQCLYVQTKIQEKGSVSPAIENLDAGLRHFSTLQASFPHSTENGLGQTGNASAVARHDGSLRMYSSTSPDHFTTPDMTMWSQSVSSSTALSGTHSMANDGVSIFEPFSSATTMHGPEGMMSDNFPFVDAAVWNLPDTFAGDAVTVVPSVGGGNAHSISEERADISGQAHTNNSMNDGQTWSSSYASSPGEIRTQNGQSVGSSASENVPENVMLDLYQRYFDTLHFSFPMVNMTRFKSRIGVSHIAPELLGLRYAMWAHAAALSPTYTNMSDHFYQQAKKTLEDPKIERSGGCTTVDALQTNILVALYELKQGLFTRAWASVSRATWLARMLKLHRLDEKGSKGSSMGQDLLPATTDTVVLEERRKTLWAAYNLNSSVGIGVDWDTGNAMDYREITTLLPVEDFSEHPASIPPLLTLDDALKLSATWVLLPYQGMIIVSSIRVCCLLHIKQLHRESILGHSYDFWTTHYHMEEIINHACTYSLGHFTPTDYINEPNVLSLSIMLKAIVICLHQAVVVKVERTNAPVERASTSKIRSIKAAIEIAATMRLLFVGPVNRAKMNPFVPWALYVALQALTRSTRRHHDASQRRPSSARPSPLDSESEANLESRRLRKFLGDANASDLPDDTSLLDAQALDSMDFLLCLLADLNSTNPLAGVFESQIKQEMKEPELAAQAGVVGLINFPLIHPLAQDHEDNELDVQFKL